MLFSPYFKNHIVIFSYFWYYINVTLKGDNKMANKKEVSKKGTKKNVISKAEQKKEEKIQQIQNN